MTKLMPVKILGRTIGTCEGWDGDPGEWAVFYKFTPAPEINLPSGDLQYQELEGLIGLGADDGTLINGQDVVTLLQAVPRDTNT